jgi:hypothetical protein
MPIPDFLKDEFFVCVMNFMVMVYNFQKDIILQHKYPLSTDTLRLLKCITVLGLWSHRMSVLSLLWAQQFSPADAGSLGNTAAVLGDTINRTVSHFVIESYQVPFWAFGIYRFRGYLNQTGTWGSVVVKALCYKSEGPGIDSRCRRGFFRDVWQFHVPWGRLSL